ncbi:MAG: helix-turn-helix transcriptional regulator [Eubacteriales bacterium]|nr:helix-turn-helix transcriptional regulator [Eubacteriales bacterium]
MSKNAIKTDQLKKRTNDEDEVKEIFSQRFHDILLDNNTTAKILADEIEVSEGILSGYRRNLNAPSISKLKKIADYFGCSTDYLLGKDEYQEKGIEEIRKRLGLSKNAVEMIENLFVMGYSDLYSKLLEGDSFRTIINLMDLIRKHQETYSEIAKELSESINKADKKETQNIMAIHYYKTIKANFYEASENYTRQINIAEYMNYLRYELNKKIFEYIDTLTGKVEDEDERFISQVVGFLDKDDVDYEYKKTIIQKERNNSYTTALKQNLKELKSI